MYTLKVIISLYYITTFLCAADKDYTLCKWISCGTSNTQGTRQNMEDRSVLMTSAYNRSVFGVLDGHGGIEVVNAIYDFLYTYQALGYFNNLWSVRIENLFTLMQRDLITSLPKHVTDNQGCTASLLWLTTQGAYCAQLGDSSIINSKGELILDHHTTYNTKEVNRVGQHNIFAKEGESLMRLGGKLAVTRSFGDLRLLNAHISAKPDIIKVPLVRNDFFVIATDGVTDFLKVDCIAAFTRLRLNDNIHPTRIAKELTIIAAHHSVYRDQSKFFAQTATELRDCFWTLDDNAIHNNDENYSYLEQAHDNQTVMVVHITE